MARRKNNDEFMRIAAVSAAVSLIVVVVFFGGSITGNSTSAYDLSVVVSSSPSCAFTDDGGGILTFGTITATEQTSGTTDSVTVENDGPVAVDVEAEVTAGVATFLGGTGTTLTATVGSVPSGATNAAGGGITLTTTAADLVTALQTGASVDEISVDFSLTSGTGPLTTGTRTSSSATTITCSLS